jgi:trehalose 6-phosphate phosphatase
MTTRYSNCHKHGKPLVVLAHDHVFFISSLDPAGQAAHLVRMPAPIPDNAALFLDIDGTLLDIAEQPHLVHIPPGLTETLTALRIRLNGAIAFISGRPLTEIDQFFPGQYPAAAEHGATIRDGQGTLYHITQRPPAYDHWLKTLTEAAVRMPGTLIEQKAVGLVIHYRQAPQYAADIKQLAESLIAASCSNTILLPAHMAYELRPTGAAKDTALTWFMDHPPFANRRPIFIGDDTTDEPAIALATKLGGQGLHVNRDFSGGPEAVRRWLGGR